MLNNGLQQPEQQGELHIKDGNGQVRVMLLDILFLQDAEGRERCRISLTDITELKRTQEELRLHKEKLEELVSARTATLTSVNQQLQEANDNLEALFRAAPLAIGMFDDQGRLLKVNPVAERIFGWPQEELEGRLPPSIPPENPEETMAVIQRALRGESFTGVELKQQCRDGSLIDISLSAAPLRDQEGRVRGFVGLAEDIAERKRAEEMLRRQAELLDLAHDAILVRDLTGRITYWNRGAEELYGWKSDEAMSKLAHRLLATEFPQSLEDIETYLLEHGRWEGELSHTAWGGRRVLVDSRWSLKRDEAGRPLAILEICHDITARRQAEEALKRSELRFQRLVEANIVGMVVSDEERIVEANDAFLRMVGHTREEMLAGDLKWVEMTPSEYLPKDAQALHELRTTGVHTPFEKTFLRKDGSEVAVMVGGVLLEEEPLSWVSFTLDISARKWLEDSLRQSEARFRAIFANASIGIATTDLMGRFQQFNAPVMRKLRYHAHRT